MSARTLIQRSVLALALGALAPTALAEAPATTPPKPAPAAPAHAHAAAPAAATPTAAPGVPAAAKPLKVDTTHSRLGFVASTVLFDVNGKFDKYEVLLEGEPNALSKAKVKVVIETASIDTEIEKRDEHLRSPEFFDAKQFPKITFTSTKVDQQGDAVTVSGVLAMRGKEKPVTIKFKRAHGKNGAGVDATTLRGKVTIKRSDFGIGAESVAAKISLEDEVELDLLVVVFD